MQSDGCLLAWIEQRDEAYFVGAYVGEDAGPNPAVGYPGRAPATQVYASLQAAQDWIMREAAALQLPVKWVNHVPWGGSDR